MCFETDIPDHFPGHERVLSELMVGPPVAAPSTNKLAHDIFDTHMRTFKATFEAVSARADMGLYEGHAVYGTFGIFRAPFGRMGMTVLRIDFAPDDDPESTIIGVLSVEHSGLRDAARGLRIIDSTLTAVMARHLEGDRAELMILRQIKLPAIGCLPISFIKRKARTIGHRNYVKLHAIVGGAAG